MAHIVTAKLIVIGKVTASADCQQVPRTARILGHPEAIEIAHSVISPSGLDHRRLITDEHRSAEWCPEPDRATAGYINLHGSIACLHLPTLFKLWHPLSQVAVEVIGRQPFTQDVVRIRRPESCFRVSRPEVRRARRQTNHCE
jgi:hypothetical protein